MFFKENFIELCSQISTLFQYIFLNRVLILAVSAQFISMLVKVVIKLITTKKFSLENMVSYGGMPSSHTVFVISALLGIGLDAQFGWSHPLFAVFLITASLVIVDAVRFRGNVDTLNKFLRKMIEEHPQFKNQVKLPRLIAHNSAEVICGVIFAIIYTLIFYLFFWHLF